MFKCALISSLLARSNLIRISLVSYLRLLQLYLFIYSLFVGLSESIIMPVFLGIFYLLDVVFTCKFYF